VIFDLDPEVPRPDASFGWEACEAAGTGPVSRGRVGVGAGATVGKMAGIDRASPGGVGSRARQTRDWTVGALVVVNAVGDVVDGAGRIVAGAGDGGDRPTMGEGGATAMFSLPGENTTLAVVATDAPLDRIGLARLARMAGTALARRIVPVHTPYDGDVVFAVSPTAEPEPITSPDLLSLGIAAREALEDAIVDAVTTAAGA
jgi:L-aminopeptidase/D-esterase-like protein